MGGYRLQAQQEVGDAAVAPPPAVASLGIDAPMCY